MTRDHLRREVARQTLAGLHTEAIRAGVNYGIVAGDQWDFERYDQGEPLCCFDPVHDLGTEYEA